MKAKKTEQICLGHQG